MSKKYCKKKYTKLSIENLEARWTPAAPVISSFGADVTFSEGPGPNPGSGPIYVARQAVISDADSTTFNTGQMRLHVASGSDANDRLTFRHFQNFTTTPNTLLYKNRVFATYTGGDGANDLVITFNAASTPVKASAAIRNLQFQNSSLDPTGADRVLQVFLTDNQGNQSNTVTKNINFTLYDDGPSLEPNSYTSNYQIGSAAVNILSGAVITDPDGGNYGEISIQHRNRASTGDRISLSGAFSFSGTNVLRNGVVIGTRNVNGGFGMNGLTITFKPNVTEQIVNDLVHSIKFRQTTVTTGYTKLYDFVVVSNLGRGESGICSINVTP
jgi:hypothetical protein